MLESRTSFAPTRRHFVLAAALAAVAGPAVAQQNDGTPITIVVGYAAGNAADVLARVVGARLSQELNASVVVENRPGANARIAIQALKNAPPDGKTMLFNTSSAMFLTPLIFKNLPYDVDKDFAPIANIGNNQIAMTVQAHAPYKNLKEFAAWLKQHPEKAQFGNEGVGSPGHLMGLQLGIAAGVPMTFVPYKVGGQMLSDQISGQITSATWALPSVYEQHKAGKLRIIGIAGPERSSIAPELPTFKEQGFDVEIISSYGAYFRAGTPKPLVDRMSAALVAAIKDPAVQKRLRELGVDPTGYGTAEFEKIIVDDRKRWRKMVDETHFSVE
ncbi:Bug family tripartite tricarboxylate transporter substrate binding protein [Pigmentiphaga soli]|uniref:Bug family tripartite tricarboxylate transporter substrate binding protein n=1 Tax=Pigmentiphaga soli TaxID=1007095 RepID=A0ABP8HJB6_9BURK